MKNSRFWALIAALVAAAVFLRFALRGYAWWGYALLFVAALLLLHRYLPVALWRVVVVLVCIGLCYFCFVEYFIIKNARTDDDVGRKYLIVLGAAVYGDQPSLTLVRRLEGALEYLNEHPDTVAIFGQPGSRARASGLLQAALPLCAVLLLSGYAIGVLFPWTSASAAWKSVLVVVETKNWRGCLTFENGAI